MFGLEELIESAESGDMLFQNQLGAVLAKGSRNFEKNEAGAVYWYAKAVKQGYMPSKWNLGTMFLNGEGGLSKDLKMAKMLIESAANQGESTACRFLSDCYREGFHFGEINEQASHKWKRLSEAALDDNGNIENPIDVEECLGIRFKKPLLLL